MNYRKYAFQYCGFAALGIFVLLLMYERSTLDPVKYSEKRSVEDSSNKEDLKRISSTRTKDYILLEDIEQSPDVESNVPKQPVKDSLEYKMYSGFRNCTTEEPVKRYIQKGDYWIFENYIKATDRFRCDETITYTTHGEYGFLHNLVVLTSRWQGPVSVAVYAPGKDFRAALETIFHLRNCVSNEIERFVTFHFFFEKDQFPKMIPNDNELAQFKTSCNKDLSLFNERITYRSEQKLLYPVNVARNVAISNAGTFFLLASDIELFPSLNIVPEFLKMLQKPDVTNTTNKRVFVLPVFEVQKGEKPPETKPELIASLEVQKAFLFHQKICYQCHTPPKFDEWIKAEIEPGLSVSHVGKRHKPHNTWEPFYIGTGDEPVFDERLSSEGRANKMTQAYAMCLLDYEYHILDKAFLVHKPGIKNVNRTVLRNQFVKNQNELIFGTIQKEYQKLYGAKKECHVMGPH